MCESIPNVLADNDISTMTALEDAFPYPCAAEDADQDADDESYPHHDVRVYNYKSAFLRHKQTAIELFELRDEVKIEQSGHACSRKKA